MHFLGVPSSRSLMIFSSKDPVYREKSEDAAMIARTALTHIRFGNFEKFFYDNEQKKQGLMRLSLALKCLVHTIKSQAVACLG